MKTPLDSNWYKQFILPLLSAAVWLQGGVQGSAATTYYWDALTGDNTVESGSGTWNTTDTTWTTSTTSVSNVTWVSGTGNVASFGGTSGTSGAYVINVATSGSLQTIAFTSTGYKLTAATSTTIALGVGATAQNGTGAGGITLSNNASAIIGDGITLTGGSGGSIPFVVQGSGTLTVASSSASAPATLKSLGNNNFNIIGGATVVVGTNGVLLAGTSSTTGTGSMVVGNSTSNATLTVDGGLVSTFTNFVVGNAAASGISTVNLVSGTIAGTSGTGILRFGTSSVSTSGTGILNLNGGTLAIGGIGILATGTGSAAYFVNLNGGTVQATQSSTNFLNSSSQITAKVLSGGAIFDTAGYNITVSQALISGTTNDGGLTKKGTGTLTLAGANTYTGATTVKSGSLVVGASGNISSTVVLGGSGGLSGTVDVSLKGSSYSLANLSGQGAMIGAVGSTITATGAVSPGVNVGELDVSTNFTLAGTAATSMEISGNGGVKGTDSDYLNVSGILTYGGSLVISSYNSYDLSQAGTYTLFNFTSSSGDFSSVTVDGVSLTKLGEVWSNSSSGYSFDESTGVLSVTAVPEPSTYAILVSGLGMLGLLRRKSRA